jgi:hypothetical protein
VLILPGDGMHDDAAFTVPEFSTCSFTVEHREVTAAQLLLCVRTPAVDHSHERFPVPAGEVLRASVIPEVRDHNVRVPDVLLEERGAGDVHTFMHIGRSVREVPECGHGMSAAVQVPQCLMRSEPRTDP